MKFKILKETWLKLLIILVSFKKKYSSDFAIPFYMIYAWMASDLLGVNSTFLTVFKWFSFALLVVSTILTILSGCNYIIKNRKVLK